MTYSKECTH